MARKNLDWHVKDCLLFVFFFFVVIDFRKMFFDWVRQADSPFRKKEKPKRSSYPGFFKN